MLIGVACVGPRRPSLDLTTPTIESSPAATSNPASVSTSASTPSASTAATVTGVSAQPTETVTSQAVAQDTPVETTPAPASSSVTPVPNLPGATVTPTLAQPATSAGHMPILTILLGTGAAAYYQQFAEPGDIGVIPAQKLKYFNTEAALISGKPIAGGFESWQAGQPLLDSLQGKVSYVAYDIEHWPQTPAAEQQDIVGTAKTMSEALHARGIKYILVPDRRFDQQYMPQIAPYADIIVLQGQRIQSNPQTFQSQLLPLIKTAKSANPNVKIFVSVGTNNGATSASMRAALESVSGSYDGIAIFSFGDQASLNTLRQFIADVRRQ
jgi:hypothetical protein